MIIMENLQPYRFAKKPRPLKAAAVAAGIQKPNTPIANPSLDFSNHWKRSVDEETTAKAPPTPIINREICMKKIEFEKEKVSDPNMHTRSPIINNGLTPYFQDNNPPIIDIRMPGTATNQTRVLAIVKVRENSSIKTGKIGGIACNEKMKENLVRKLTSNALVL